MWYNESILYQVYPLGFCGAPHQNDGALVSRLTKITEWIDYFKELGINTILLNPLFQSDAHGYDTRDFQQLDCRLGTNEDLNDLCHALHRNDIRIILDGVFNHVGRGFWAFCDLLKNRQNSQYRDWFFVDWNGNNAYNDGFYYQGWEGHYELVKLNLNCPAVRDHIFECVGKWINELDIDGLRLDVAYCLDKGFIQDLRRFCKSIKPDFLLIGEVLFGDYNLIVNNNMLDSCTNYECYKGIHSSLNSNNMFEIAHSLNRQFGPENWTIYKGLPLLSFIDNHDVSRIASILNEPEMVNAAFGLMMGMPGIPCLYYGSEWGQKGNKKEGDHALRPAVSAPVKNQLAELVKKLIAIRKSSPALKYGSYKNIIIENLCLVFEREYQNEVVRVGINLTPSQRVIDANATAWDMLEDKITEKLVIPPFGTAFWSVNRRA